MSLNPLSLNISKCRQTVAVKIIRAAYIHLSATKFSSSVDFQQNLLSIGKTVLQQDTAKLERNAQQRKVSIDINELVKVGKDYFKLESAMQKLVDERKPLTKKIIKEKLGPETEEMKQANELKEEIKLLEEEIIPAKEDFVNLVSQLPNWSHPSAPVGDYSECREIHAHGSKPGFSFPVRNHLTIGEQHDIVDFESGSKVTGSNFYYLKGVAAALEMALCQYSMLKAISKVRQLIEMGYHPVITPDVIHQEMMQGSGFVPRTKTAEVYKLEDHHYCLSGTAEIPLVGMYAASRLALKNLPIRMVAFGRCFRPETGGSGNTNKGLYRVHQFSKVELLAFTSVESGTESEHMLQEMVTIQKEITEELGLHYRVLEMSTEELGSPAYQKYDLEVWMPGRDSFGETCSASNCTDFQSRRLSITYKSPVMEDGRNKVVHPHTVNATACAIPRIILAILENFQLEDGSVKIPEVLHPHLPPEFRQLKPHNKKNHREKKTSHHTTSSQGSEEMSV